MTTDPSRSYTTTIEVDRPAADAYAAILDVRSWWSEQIEGPTDELGAEFDYEYQDVHRCRVRVTDLAPNRRVAWHVVDNHFNFVAAHDEWTDTDIVFEITEDGEGSQIRFTHIGLTPEYECYDVCSNAWGGYLTSSLRDLVNTGVGQPNPKDDGKAPSHQDAAGVHRSVRS